MFIIPELCKLRKYIIIFTLNEQGVHISIYIFILFFNPNPAEILSHLVHEEGRGQFVPSPLSPVIAVKEGQHKKQRIK